MKREIEMTQSSSGNWTWQRPALAACAGVLAVALFALPRLARAEHTWWPRVPGDIRVQDGSRPYLKGHAVGTQNYVCLPSATGFAWTLFGPQATLFDDDDKQIITHFLSRNPDEAGLARATWQHSRDTSAVWASLFSQSSDPAYVASGAIPWFLLQVVGDEYGPTGGHQLTRTTWIQRVNTRAGIAPATGCALAADLGKKALVPYEADYIFYKGTNDDDD